MTPVRRILCPIDFSDASQAAFTHAERLARDSGAELIVLHVFEPPDFWSSGGQVDPVVADLQQKLQTVRSSSPGVRVRHLLHAGQPGEVICWVAQEQGCELIVMGTHGRTGLMHVLLGSIAEWVVRHARCPVLTVRLRAGDEPPLAEPESLQRMPPLL